MKPVASTMTEVDNLPGEEVKFSISSANSAWVMRSMADLYSNRELACVREYSTNAYDANKEKALAEGTEIKPIQVSLPTAMNPYFTVTDEGYGMSRQQLTEVYTQFGESTKRESDDFNGMLGFGSKSAIAYTNTFTVTSVSNHKKNVAVITRREDAMGGYLVTLKVVVDNIPTTDSSGVSIQIPVHNAQEFEQKANDFYRFWQPGTVIVNGKQPEWAVGDKIDEGLYYHTTGGYNNTSYVVMGNVPYRIINSDALFPTGMNRISFVAYVPVGTVEFTPSREDLKYSEHTKGNLRKIITDFVDRSVATAKAEIEGSTTHAEAFKNWTKWSNVIGNRQVADLTFKGDKLVQNFDIDGISIDFGGYRTYTYKINHYTVHASMTSYFVTDFDIALTATHKRKIKAWAQATSRAASQFVVTAQSTVDSPWVDPTRVVTWEQVKNEAPKPPKKPKVVNTAPGRKAGTFDIITRKKGRSTECDVPITKDLYFVSVKEYNVSKDLHNVLDEFDLDHEVVLVPANRRDKFLRFYPHAKEILPILRAQIVLDGPSLLSADAKTYLGTDPRQAEILADMDQSKIDDPDLVALCRLYSKPEAEYTEDYEKNFRLAKVLGIEHEFERHRWQNRWDRRDDPISIKYPLASGYNIYKNTVNATKENNHIYLYINAVYAARKKGIYV